MESEDEDVERLKIYNEVHRLLKAENF